MKAVRDHRRVGWYRIDDELLDEYGSHIGPYGIAVYNVLCRYANDDQQAFPSLNRIAKKVNMSRTTVVKALDKLEQQKLIARERRLSAAGDADSTIYTLLDIKGVVHEVDNGVVHEVDNVVHQVNNPVHEVDNGVVHEVDNGCSPGEQDLDLLNQIQIELEEIPPVVPPSGDAPARQKKTRRTKTHTAPADFVITDALRTWADIEVPEVDIDRETQKFLNHEFDKPHGEWIGTWKNWMLRAVNDRYAARKVREVAQEVRGPCQHPYGFVAMPELGYRECPACKTQIPLQVAAVVSGREQAAQTQTPQPFTVQENGNGALRY